MNFFEFYQIPVSFQVDEPEMKRIFYRNSKKFHPDFHTLSDDAQQADMLEMSSLNNEAYKTLSDPDLRMRYILQLYGLLSDEQQPNTLPQSFLMDMMDINEALMELEFDFEEKRFEEVQHQVQQLENQLYQSIAPQLLTTNTDSTWDAALIAIRDFYLKKRYLLRIKENFPNLKPG
ncbi:MAG: Fe-S protein assembly co-chaperone HscB [Bacteroidota bacterium]